MKFIQLSVKSKKIKSPQFAIVDDDVFEEISKQSWRIHRPSKHSKTLYAYSSKTNESIAMHRFVLGLKRGDGIIVDHIDGNGLNNQRINLRIATVSQNSANGLPRVGRKYKGVYPSKTKGKWIAEYYYFGKKHIGTFNTEEEAALAYNEKTIEAYGEFARLNIVKTSNPKTK